MYQKSWWYDLQFLKYRVWQTEISNYGSFSALLPSLPHPLNPKKSPGDTTITIKDNHMIYGSWDIKQNRQFFFSLWAIFCLFTPLTTQKINILKKGKIYLEISFYTSVPNHNQMLHCSWDMACNRLIVIFHFEIFFDLPPPPPFPFPPPNSPKKQNLRKMKKTLDISSFYKVY